MSAMYECAHRKIRQDYEGSRTTDTWPMRGTMIGEKTNEKEKRTA